MERTVPLPSYFDGRAACQIFGNLIDADQRALVSRIVFDFSTLRFIQAVGVASFSTLIEWLRKREVTVDFINHNAHSPANMYLDSFGFFEVYLGGRLFGSGQRETTMSLKRVRHSESHGWLEFELVPWIASKLDISETSLADLKTCFQEIFNNVIDHSGEEIGCVHVQWHPNVDRICAAVSDFGIGIPNAMRKAFPMLSDHHAIKYATDEGVTSKRGRNLGAGLDVLVKNVVGLNQGTVEIRSNRGLCCCYMVQGGVRKEARGERGFYPGTLVDIMFRTDTIARDQVEPEEFQWF